MIRKAVLLICLFVLALPATVRAQTLIMGCFPDAMPPFINEAPDNSGFLKDLFTQAGKKAGFEVSIVRFPLREMLIALEKGAVDFHPYLHYLFNRDYFVQFFPVFRIGYKSTYLAWSRSSRFYRSFGNPGYNHTGFPTPTNTRLTMRPDCPAARFLGALQELRRNGYIQALRIKYGLRRY